MATASIDILEVLARKARELGSQRALAQFLGVDEGYLSRVLRGERDVTDAFLKPLGLERVTVIRKAE